MRVVNAIFAAVLLLFVAVQYNDPDFALWGTIYGFGALFTGIAALRPSLFAMRGLRALYFATLVASIGGVVYYWPRTPNWWMRDVWWQTETAREGMGMMIILFAMIAAGVTVLSIRRQV